jgi:hypothetical protein
MSRAIETIPDDPRSLLKRYFFRSRHGAVPLGRSLLFATSDPFLVTNQLSIGQLATGPLPIDPLSIDPLSIGKPKTQNGDIVAL